MPEISQQQPVRRVLSGMRPTGKLHLGNYMGALHNWVRLQDSYECFFFIADWHALTTDYADPGQIKQNTVDVALDFLAAGLDPEKTTIFIQSHVRQHAELHLLFSMVTPLGWLERVPTYKEQQENLRGKDLSTYGFLGYPLLQSADILLYRPQYVPVGADQVAHVELTREVARRFNSLYKTAVFPEPEALLTPTPKLPGTDGRKMSKSYGNTIVLTDPPALVVSKVHGMSTNGQRLRQSDPGDPDLCPVGDLHKVFSSAEVLDETQRGCRAAKIPCEWCKIQAGRSVNDITEPIHDRRAKLEEKIDETWDMLIAQGEKAARSAEEAMGPVRAALNISHDLGSARRHFGFTAADKEKRRDLSQFSESLRLLPEQRANFLREYWRKNIVPYDVVLTTEPNRVLTSLAKEIEEPFLTLKQKRVWIGAPKHLAAADEWIFNIPLKSNKVWSVRSYEVWVLLLWHGEKKWLEDFVIPQRIFSSRISAMKKEEPEVGEMFFGFQVIVKQSGAGFSMQIGKSGDPVDITPFRANYEPLN